MGLLEAAGQGIAEATSTQKPVQHQAGTNLRAGQALVGQSLTGRNPASQINPPSKLNPTQYKEDDDGLVRGAAKQMADAADQLKDQLQAVFDNSGKKVQSSLPTELGFTLPGPALTPGSGVSLRLAKAFKEVARVVTSLTLFKAQGNKLEKASETMVKLAKTIYQRAGSLLTLEAPILMLRSRVTQINGPVLFLAADDSYLQADTFQQRTNHWLLSSQKMTVLTNESVTFAVGGDFKAIASDEIKLQAGQALKLSGQTNVSILSNATLEIGSQGPLTIKGATVDIQAAGLIQLGGGAATPPTPDIVTPPTSLPALTADTPDTLPQAMLPSTGFGENPATVQPPRLSKMDSPNF